MPKIGPDGKRDHAAEYQARGGKNYESTKQYARASQRAMRQLARMHPVDYELLLSTELKKERGRQE